MVTIASRKGANVKTAGAWSTKDGTVKCPVCSAEYFLGQQMPFKDDAVWSKMIQELTDLLEDDHQNGRKHLDKVEFDV
jgi:uncharacterized Zn finger protein (UPF0148 family)